MSRRFRILFLSWRDLHHPEAGGAEKYVTEVAEGLAARGHQVTIRTAAYPGALKDEIVNGVAYTRRGGRYGVYVRALASRATGRSRADVVVDIQNGVPFLSPLVGRPRVVNLVHHVHKEQWPVVLGERAARVGWWLESRVAPRVYAKSPYVTVSPATRRELAQLGVDPTRVRILPNGAEPPPPQAVAKAAQPRIIVLGRLVPHKRVELAMDAVAKLLPEFPDLRLHIVGGGWWQPKLAEHAERLAITDHIVMTDHVSEAEKHRLLAESWVLAIPSLKEGWGLVVLEAGLHRTPSIGFRSAGGLTDSIRDGETGLLVDTEEEFAAGLRRLLEDADLRERLGARAHAFAEQFEWEETVLGWEQIIEAMVTARTEASGSSHIES